VCGRYPATKSILRFAPAYKMAPQSTKRSSAKDDDFVLTLSDDEVEPQIEEEDDDNEMQGSNTPATDNKKRKREVEAAKPKNKKQKQQEKLQLKNAKKNKKNAEPVPEPESEEEEEDDDAAADATEDDGVLNPEFEFDVGGAANLGVTEGFDGWGAAEKTEKRWGDKKAVDIDDIIERRQAKKAEAAAKKQKKQAAQEKVESASASEDDAASGDEMPIDFEDDELMAEDAFGMAVDGDEEESDAEGPEPGSGDEDEEDDEDKDENEDSDDDAASDNDSVATPVRHPDDIGSDRESDVESEVDEEEAEKRKAFFAPEEKVDTKANMAKMTFQEFNLSRPILRGLAAVGFTDPTPIQRKAIPVGLLGKDIVGSAVTGSGKTAAFIVPILERLLFRPRKVPTSRVVILMPTRELAVQCYNVSVKLATFTDVTFCQLVGGFSLREQENVLKKRPDVIIATPGRFIDHMRNSPSFTVDTLEILVLDEADRMLEDGFADELNEILTTIPKSRQTMLFSATMTESIDKLIRVGMNRPMRLMVDAKKNTVSTLVQEFVRLRPGREDKRLGYLMYLCKEVYTKRVIIFFRQKKEAHRVRIIFGLLGLKAAELHGSLSQEQVCFKSSLSLMNYTNSNSVSNPLRTSVMARLPSFSPRTLLLVVWISRVSRQSSTTRLPRVTRSTCIVLVVPPVPAALVVHALSPLSPTVRLSSLPSEQARRKVPRLPVVWLSKPLQTAGPRRPRTWPMKSMRSCRKRRLRSNSPRPRCSSPRVRTS
jgi:ATP-dependent RNA helicase DDX27